MLNGIKINESLRRQYREKGYWGDKTLLDYWKGTVSLCGDREYVVDDRGNRYTYKELDDHAGRVASYLKEAGVKNQDVVSYQIPIWSEFVIVSMACLKIGAIMNPIGICFAGEELRVLLALSKSVAYFCAASFRKINYVENIQSIRKDLPCLNHVVLLGTDKETSGFNRLDHILEEYLPYGGESQAKSDEVALILCTSGTTRGIKEVMLTHNNILFSELNFNKELGLTRDDIMFMPAPLNHATGFHHGVIATMLLGAKLVLQQKFKCKEAIEQMEQEGCTYSMGATPFIYDILKTMEAEGPKQIPLKFYLCGGAPVPEQMVERAWNYGIRLCEVYGSTESVPHVFVRPEESGKQNGLSSGRPMNGVEVRIVDDAGREVPCGTPGEEVSRGPNVFVGYLNDSESTSQALDRDGWFYSGDICTCDESGNIHVIGRKKDMIVRGGENLNANDIDNDIEGCPGLTDHAVIGMPDERLGERICAYVVMKDGVESMTTDRMAEYLRSKGINKRYWPERLEVIDKIPRTDSGKVKKYRLQEDLKERIEEKPKSDGRKETPCLLM